MKKFYCLRKTKSGSFSNKKKIGLFGIITLFMAFVASPFPANAIPSFARQHAILCFPS